MKITVANKIDKAFKRASQYFIIKADSKKLKIEVTGLPKREEAEADINEQLIVEYYSR